MESCPTGRPVGRSPETTSARARRLRHSPKVEALSKRGSDVRHSTDTTRPVTPWMRCASDHAPVPPAAASAHTAQQLYEG